MLEKNKIYHIDCLDGLKLMQDDFCDIAITSPPYKDKDGYSDNLMSFTFKELYRILKPNSLFFLNFGHLANFKFRPFYVCHLALQVGFHLNDTIIWQKTQFSPIQGNKRLNNLTEFIFLMFKGKMPNLDRLSLGVPYQDKSNIGRYSDTDLRCGGNIWRFGYETVQHKSQKLHNDRFPLELPIRCIKLSGLKRGILIDPFMGSATSAIASNLMGLDFIGFEKEKRYFEVGKNRIDKYEIIKSFQG